LNDLNLVLPASNIDKFDCRTTRDTDGGGRG
jgi:hypothetical protein